MPLRRPALALALGCGVVCSLILLGRPDFAAAAQRHAKVMAVSTPGLGVGPRAANYDVSCPRGLKAVGGGFSSPAIGVAGSLVPGGSAIAVIPVVIESRRLNARTWRVTERAALNPAVASFAPQGTTVTASVYCRKIKGRVTSVFGAAGPSTTSSSPSTAEATCPKGRVALAGGWSLGVSDSGFVDPSVYESFRDGSRAWRVSATPNTDSQVSTLAYAYCARERKPPRTRRRAVKSSITPVVCPEGLAAAAGGFQSVPGAVIQESIGSSARKDGRFKPNVPYRAGRNWRIGAGPLEAPPTTTTAFAYCS